MKKEEKVEIINKGTKKDRDRIQHCLQDIQNHLQEFVKIVDEQQKLYDAELKHPKTHLSGCIIIFSTYMVFSHVPEVFYDQPENSSRDFRLTWISLIMLAVVAAFYRPIYKSPYEINISLKEDFPHIQKLLDDIQLIIDQLVFYHGILSKDDTSQQHLGEIITYLENKVTLLNKIQYLPDPIQHLTHLQKSLSKLLNDYTNKLEGCVDYFHDRDVARRYFTFLIIYKDADKHDPLTRLPFECVKQIIDYWLDLLSLPPVHKIKMGLVSRPSFFFLKQDDFISDKMIVSENITYS